jgi:uncharacterized protein
MDTAVLLAYEVNLRGGYLMRILDAISFVLLIVGGINWGLFGLFGVDLIAYLFDGSTSAMSRILYDIVGFAAVYMFFAGWSLKQRWHVPRDIDILDRAA